MPTDSYNFKINEEVQSFELVKTSDVSCDLKIVVKHKREVVRAGFVPTIYESDETIQNYQFSLPKSIETFRNISAIVYILPDNLNEMVMIHSESVKVNIEVSEGDRIKISPFNFCVFYFPTPVRPYLEKSGQASVESSEVDNTGSLVLHYQKINPPSQSVFGKFFIA